MLMLMPDPDDVVVATSCLFRNGPSPKRLTGRAMMREILESAYSIRDEEAQTMIADIDISQSARLLPITAIAERIGVPADALEVYGRFKAKLTPEFTRSLSDRPDGKLILVTAINPTPAGEGKTTTTIGLGDALNRIGHKTVVCLREPSLGPVFGLKGGATGGGYAQVAPMEDINLHFTGDFGAVSLAHNLLAALLDNHIHHGNELDIDTRRIVFRRVVDMNDRALREIVCGLGGPGNGFVREDGFDIVVASEVMAILCLATDIMDLRARLGDIVVAYTRSRRAVTARDLQAHGAMAALLRDAFKPNLVQTLENNPALVHGGPFANIAHGCNSVIATATALKLAEYVVTEAGFGADLGAEKFIDIKCRKAGLAPSAAVVVATLRALKYHGGSALERLNEPDLDALGRGVANLERHVANLKEVFGIPCVVAVNRFTSDTAPELELLRERIAPLGVAVISAEHWAQGGAGAVALAHEVVDLASRPSDMEFLYTDELPLIDKITAVAKRIYGARAIDMSGAVRSRLERLQADGFGHFPVCIAKTPYSFASDPALRGAPSGHILTVREVQLRAGAQFVVAVCGDVRTMPGLPKHPAAARIDIDANGKISGLF
jgi:formate--tetrahydrofolate ligase